MVLIHGTNILVDDFNPNRPDRSSYIYFLTHFHQDFFQGLDKSWANEKIYCSPITKDFLLDRYPNLKNVEALTLEDAPHTIYLDKKLSIYIEVTLFDSNHCLGSVMFLFSGYMGNILHTGDFRFTPKMLTELKDLYPETRRNSQNKGVSIEIDELILDATFCDPIFKFPRRNEAFKVIVKIINENKDRRCCVVLDVLGKEEMLVHLATHYKTKVDFEVNLFI